MHADDHADASTGALVTSALNAVEAAVARKKELARRLLAALAGIDSRLRQCGAEREVHGQTERLWRRRRAALRRLPAGVRGAVMACPGCDRLLYTTEAR